MKKIVFVSVLMLSSFFIFAHTPLMAIEDNGDGTIYIEGGFSNGASAAGVKLYLTDKASGEKIWDGEFPDTGSVNLQIPNVPYTVTFDAGPGHVIVKDGPEPPAGFGNAEAAGGAESSGGENASPEKESRETVPSAASISSAWLPMDTVSAMPNVGPSFTAIAALVFSIVNFALILFLFSKNKKTGGR